MPICLASLPILPGSAAGAAALNIYIYIYIRIYVKPFGTSALLYRIPVAYRVWWVNPRCLRSIPVSVGGDACACLLVEYHIYTVALLASNPQRNGDHPANIVS